MFSLYMVQVSIMDVVVLFSFFPTPPPLFCLFLLPLHSFSSSFYSSSPLFFLLLFLLLLLSSLNVGFYRHIKLAKISQSLSILQIIHSQNTYYRNIFLYISPCTVYEPTTCYSYDLLQKHYNLGFEGWSFQMICKSNLKDDLCQTSSIYSVYFQKWT